MTELGLRILVVEDIADYLTIIGKFFKDERGCDVDHANSADMAISALRGKKAYDILSLDLDLRQGSGNKKSGLEVLDEATAGSHDKFPGLVVISGALEDQDIQRYLQVRGAGDLMNRISKYRIPYMVIPKVKDQAAFAESLSDLSITDLEYLAGRKPARPNVFAQNKNKTWRLLFGSEKDYQSGPDILGMKMIRELLDKPNIHTNVSTLWLVLHRPPQGGCQESLVDQMSSPGSGADLISDEEAVASYKKDMGRLEQQIKETAAEIVEERSGGDAATEQRLLVKLHKLNKDFDGIQRLVTRKDDVQGNERYTSLRTGFSKHFDRALAAINAVHPELAKHLEESIHYDKGEYWYASDMQWQLYEHAS